MAAETEHEVIKVCRSDGCDTGPGYWPVEAPKVVKKATKDAPEKVARTKPQMVRLDEKDPRFVDWRIKLGILLKQEMAARPTEGIPWYVEFPRGYWLYERSKHLYVSGYPIKSKLFRSPQEFGVHLLWLFSSSDDRADCCCVYCNVPSAGRGTPSVDEAPAAKRRQAEEPRQDAQTPYARAVSNLYTSGFSVSELDPPGQARIQSLPGGPMAASQPVLAPAPSAPVPSASTVPPPVPGPALPLLYRPGELVWYTKGPSWRLGLITTSITKPVPKSDTESDTKPDTESDKKPDETHWIMPLGHSYFRQPQVGKKNGEIRPFQAFTVPPVSINNFKGHTYDVIPWEKALMNLTPEQVKTHRDVILLDASKLAAQKIDSCYSLFGKLGQQGNVSLYQGIFLGAERIEVGDTLRVNPPASLKAEGAVYFGLHAIQLDGPSEVVHSKDPPPYRAVHFGGMFYELHEGGDARRVTVPDDALPQALKVESKWRKQVASGQPLSWNTLSGYMMLAESDIRGRFYPTEELAPILKPVEFEKVPNEVNRVDVTPALNGRVVSRSGDPKTTGWMENRLKAAGASIPHNTEFVLEPREEEETDPK